MAAECQSLVVAVRGGSVGRDWRAGESGRQAARPTEEPAKSQPRASAAPPLSRLPETAYRIPAALKLGQPVLNRL